jgi:hypothetical protein
LIPSLCIVIGDALWPPFGGCPFASVASYYGGSVAVG